jgi:hypothetical protein
MVAGVAAPGLLWSQAGGEAAKPDRWIGVAVGQVPEIVRAHLSVPPGVGVIVVDVVPDGPAAKAGLRRHDVIVDVDKTEVKSLPDLVSAIGEAASDEVRVVWWRRGQEHEAMVKAVPRPEDLAASGFSGLGSAGGAPNAQNPNAPNMDQLREWMDRLQSGGQGLAGPRLRWRIPGATGNEPFPNGVSVQIERQNDQPAKIKVQRGDETWELTENDVDQLPEDLQGTVKRMLGQGGGIDLENGILGFDQLDLVPTPGGASGISPDVDRRFEEMNRRMEQLFDELRGFREEQRQPELDKEPTDEA